ncbi:MAG: alpha/beta hydrolase [Frankiales bacterium]|nr:alpha/beta hydrolase [Frankiales bacterium]
MTTLGLVHGAYHGTWQWGPLVAELERRGQRCVCVDLPVDDPNCGVLDYAAAAARAWAGIDDLVVVGHSLGGRVIPFIAELRAVRELVFLAGAVQDGVFGPVPDGPALLISATDRTVGDDGLVRISERAVERYFYHDVPPSLRAWAGSQLRPQSERAVAPVRIPRLDPVPAVSYIVCTDDRAMSPAWQRAVASRTLRVRPYEIAGGHSPFLARPAELADLLVHIATGADRAGSG